jgi:hypothetical protein
MRTKKDVCSENPNNPVWFTEECLNKIDRKKWPAMDHIRIADCAPDGDSIVKEWQKQMEKSIKERWQIFYDCLVKSLTSSIRRYKKNHGQDPSLLIVCHEVRSLLESKELAEFVVQGEVKFPFDHRTWYGIPIKEDRFDSITNITKRAGWFKLI